jgi:hypothetical protein
MTNNAEEKKPTERKRRPTSPMLITIVMGVLGTLTAPVTACVYNVMSLNVEQKKATMEIRLQRSKQEHEIQLSFLRELEKAGENLAYRRDMLSFYSEMHPNGAIKKWAKEQRDRAQEALAEDAATLGQVTLEGAMDDLEKLEEQEAPKPEVEKARKKVKDATGARKEALKMKAGILGSGAVQEDLDQLLLSEMAQSSGKKE